jgi:uncharacterized OsmC-like protein
MDDKTIKAHLKREEGFRLRVGFPGSDISDLIVDEPPPLGEDAGPKATQLVATAVGTCLSHSLLFCLQRSRTEVEELETEVTATVSRNEEGRLRISGIQVTITPLLAPDAPGEEGKARGRLERCKGLFEDFCTVAESLKGGIPVEVSVAEPAVQQ